MKKFLFASALAGALVSGASFGQAQKLEKTRVTLGVGGKALLYYLPLTIAEQKNFFKEQGLDVEIQDFAGGSRSLQALVGGSVDMVAGAYEHTIRMQARGQDIRAVIEMGRFPAISVLVKKGVAWKSAADFKGMKIGVTAPGSSTNMLIQFAMVKAGLAPNDAAFIGVGSSSSAMAAMQKGEIQALSHLEPVTSMLERSGDARVVIDTRTQEGTRALFGGSNPAAVLYLRAEFIKANPNTVQAAVNALYKALKWLETATPEDIAMTVPAKYLLGDRELYLLAAKNSQGAYSRTGVIDRTGMESTYAMLQQFEKSLKGVKLDVGVTFVDTFARKAPDLVK